MKKLVGVFWLCLVGLVFVANFAMGAAYIKFDGVDGEAQDMDHNGWSDVLEVEQVYLLQQFGDTKNKEVLSKELEVNDLVVRMELDKAGPKIAEALLEGKAFSTVEIEITASYTDEGRVTYYKNELSNVRVTGYQLSASGDAEGVPIQAVSLSFTGITVTYTEYDSEGNKKGDVGYSYPQ